MGKGALRAVCTTSAQTRMVARLRFAHPTQSTWRLLWPADHELRVLRRVGSPKFIIGRAFCAARWPTHLRVRPYCRLFSVAAAGVTVAAGAVAALLLLLFPAPNSRRVGLRSRLFTARLMSPKIGRA